MDFLFRFFEDAKVDLEFFLDGVRLRQETLQFGKGKDCECTVASEIDFKTGSLLKIKARITAKDYSDSVEQSFLLIDVAGWARVMLDERLNFPERLMAVEKKLKATGVQENLLARVKKRAPVSKETEPEADDDTDIEAWYHSLDSDGEPPSIGDRIINALVDLSFGPLLRAEKKKEGKQRQATQEVDEAKDDVDKNPRRLTLKEDQARLGVSLPQVLHPMEHFEIDVFDTVFHNVGADYTYSSLSKKWDRLGMVSLFDWFKENYAECLEEHVPDPESEPEMYARYKETIVVITFVGDGHTLVCWHPKAGWMTRSEDSELAPIVDEISGQPLSGIEVLLSSFDLVHAINQYDEVRAKNCESDAPTNRGTTGFYFRQFRSELPGQGEP